ncbi:MAG: DHHA1 domain-containing protein, partial [Pseudomonadota bacterium]
EIGGFRIIHQSGVAAGIRRIEAVTGEAMIEQAREQGEQLRTAAGLLRIQPGQLEGQISQLLHDRKAMQREISDLKRKLAQGLGDASNGAAEQIAGIMFTHKTVRDLQAGDCRDMVDRLKQQMGSGLVLLINVQDDNRAGLLVGVTSDLTDRFDAVQLVRLAAGALGGRGGGGRPDLAQSGASDASNPGRAIQAVQGKIKELAQA